MPIASPAAVPTGGVARHAGHLSKHITGASEQTDRGQDDNAAGKARIVFGKRGAAA